jgi:hypothetical protein
MERDPGVYNQILRHGLVGRPDTIAQRIDEYIDVGVGQFFLAFQVPLDSQALELFMDAVKHNSASKVKYNFPFLLPQVGNISLRSKLATHQNDFSSATYLM